MWIIFSARLVFLKMVLDWSSVLDLTPVTYNTDGLVLAGLSSLKAHDLKVTSCLILDRYLKPGLQENDFWHYAHLKMKYFQWPMICPNHMSNFVHHLSIKKDFEPPLCCIQYESTTHSYKLKIELVADFGLILKKNQNALFNSITCKKLVKCSGPMNDSLENIDKMSYSDLLSLVID